MYKILLLIDLSEQYGRSLMQGMVRYSNEHGPWVFCKMPIYFREKHGVKGVLKWARDWGANGIVAALESEAGASQIVASGIPVIAQDYKERFTNIPNITGNYHETGKMAARYFLSRGYRHFAFYGFGDIVWSRERAQGFEWQVRDAGYQVQYFESKKKGTHDLWYYKPSPLSAWLKSLPSNVALMACDDNQGHHILEACKIAGIRVPDDMAVLGVDNDELVCHLTEPSMSSIALDTERGGYEAARLLEHMIIHRVQNPGNIIIRPTAIVTRHSTDILATDDKMIANALKYIHQHIELNPGVKEVLAQIPLSRRALEIRFRNATGLPIYKYIQALRLEKFSNQLLVSESSIMDIAIGLGLGDNKNISRAFRKLKGCSPAEYRRRNQ